MARVVVAPSASEDLDTLIRTRNLPSNTRSRVKARLRLLADSPLQGEQLAGRWAGSGYVLGPWRWMLIVYTLDERAGQVSVLTIQDSRTARSATSAR